MLHAIAKKLISLAYWLAPALKPSPTPDRAGGVGEER